jgi:hypothetical protein
MALLQGVPCAEDGGWFVTQLQAWHGSAAARLLAALQSL